MGKIGFKYNTGVTNSYMSVMLENLIYKAKIGNWILEMEPMVGTFYWSNDKVNAVIYATPFWEGSVGIDWVVSAEDGTINEAGLEPFTVSGDPKADIKNYMETCRNIIKKFLKNSLHHS